MFYTSVVNQITCASNVHSRFNPMFSRSLLTNRAVVHHASNRKIFTVNTHPSFRSVRINANNAGLVIIPHQTNVIVERFGSFKEILSSGPHLMIPFIDRIAYIHSLKEEAISIPAQSSITSDNVALSIDGILYIKITDPYMAAYNIEQPLQAISQLAQTAMRSAIGQMSLDRTFAEREHLNEVVVQMLKEATKEWGLQCLRYEVRDIRPPMGVSQAMELQAEAERRKRAEILTSEGHRQAEVNLAEGRRAADILKAEGDAQAITLKADATAKALNAVNEALSKENGRDAASLKIAEQYVDAFGNLAKSSNTVIVPANVNDPAAMITQALAVFGKVSGNSGLLGVPKDSSSTVDQSKSSVPTVSINDKGDLTLN